MNIQIGTPVKDPHNLRNGVIASIQQPDCEKMVFGAKGLLPAGRDIVIVWQDHTLLHESEVSIEDLVNEAQRLNIGLVNDAPEKLARALAIREHEQEHARIEQAQLKAIREAYIEGIRPKIPAGSKSVIIAEYMVDDSDSQSDYFNSHASKTIILAFSTHKRDLFPEMRKAALNHTETESLATAPDSAEHRQKYSMGGGFFLKDEYRHQNGWKISKKAIDYGDDQAQQVPTGEWAVVEANTARRALKGNTTPSATSGEVSIEAHTHSKKGFDFFIVITPNRVEREDYMNMLAAAKSRGGWYSRKFGVSPAGFAFKDENQAVAFSENDIIGHETTPIETQSKTTKVVKSGTNGDKFRTMADKLQSEIDSKFADRVTNTPKQRRQAASARHDGAQLERTQQALNALAGVIDAGNLTPKLSSFTSKKAVHSAMASFIDRSNAGYYDAGIDTGKPYSDDENTLALWDLLKPVDPAIVKKRELQAQIEKLANTKIEGYFPTPAPIVEQMIDWANLTGPNNPDEFLILEPEGGSGAICDGIANAGFSDCLHVIETNNKLREVLEMKGYSLVGHDFTQFDALDTYDRALMNPPFERGQDAEHVQQAFKCLKDGGSLVAIMSPGPFFRSDKKSQQFRDWFEALNGEKIELPEGSFKQSGTGVATLMVRVEK